MSKPLVLITGATGYLGTHIVQDLLDSGYPVRMLSRAAKIDAARKQFGNKVDILLLTSLTEDDFTEALKGVGALIHTAAPVVGREKPESMVKSAKDGSLNIVRQAVAAGIKRIVMTSSWATCVNFDLGYDEYLTEYVYTDKDWCRMTYEETISSRNPLIVYVGAKTLAEKEVWKFADKHPEVDITTINPPFLYGPILSRSPVTKGSISTFATAGVFYDSVLQAAGAGLKLQNPQMAFPVTIDVRDAAHAHVLALTAPPESQVGRKRIVIGGPNFTWKDTVEHLQKVRPELVAKERLRDASGVKNPEHIATIDNMRAKEVLGFGENIPWQKTVEDMVDSVLEIEQAA